MSPELFDLLSQKDSDLTYIIESLERNLESQLKLKDLVLDKVASLFLNNRYDIEDINKEISKIEAGLDKYMHLQTELNQLIKDNK